MGFLTGAFLKIYSAKQRLNLQHRLTSVTMQLQRAQRQSGDIQKRLTQMKQMQSMNMKAMQSYMMRGASAEMNQSIFTIQNNSSLSDADKNAQLMQINSKFSAAQQQIALEFSQQQAQQEMAMQEFEEAQLEPLKNLEESLTVEKANIESQLTLVKEQEDKAKEMEKASKNDFTPEYTGGG